MKTLLATTLTCAALLAGCGDDNTTFQGITDADIAALGLKQGVAGNTATHVGNCMPGTSISSSCKYESLDAALWLIPEAKADTYPADRTGAGCRVNVSGHQPTEADATVVSSLKSGRYGVEVAPGRYMPVIVEANGCGTCSLNQGGLAHACPVIEVEAGKVTKQDVVLDKAVY